MCVPNQTKHLSPLTAQGGIALLPLPWNHLNQPFFSSQNRSRSACFSGQYNAAKISQGRGLEDRSSNWVFVTGLVGNH
jgi:hypothetical protein